MVDLVPTTRLLPTVAGTAIEPFWAATAQERLCFPFCECCAAVRWPLRGACPHCHRPTPVRWQDVEPTGRVVSHTRVHRRFHPAIPEVPYWIALVELAHGIRIVGGFDGGGEPPRVGQAVRPRFEHLPTATLVSWQPRRPEVAQAAAEDREVNP
ncbi:Zn-ribbon domain-containing OB-fold protein [Actinophytocola sp.]|uniref:Zn-ribbon domain-containing OB-fold protein n=1 Tax=Actinophytocola sp. TaxID=1872138 RepID=UPI003D6A4650